MRVPHRAVLAIAISALSFALPATAQERGKRAPAADNASGARPMADAADKRDVRNNSEVATRMLGNPEFLQALRKGDAKAAKRIFVAHGGSADQVILVPVVGWNSTTGYNVSEPFPDGPINPVPCQRWIAVPWGPNNGVKYVCGGIDKNGDFNWVN